MLWVRFDVDDRKAPTPDFCLADAKGSQVCLRTYLDNSNLVLYFSGETGNLDDLQIIKGITKRYQEYQAEEANILAVIPSLPTDFYARQAISSLPFPVLIDPESKARHTYVQLMDQSLTSPEDPLTFVLDRFGSPYACLIGSEDENALHEGVLGWLRYIGIQCPE